MLPRGALLRVMCLCSTIPPPPSRSRALPPWRFPSRTSTMNDAKRNSNRSTLSRLQAQLLHTCTSAPAITAAKTGARLPPLHTHTHAHTHTHKHTHTSALLVLDVREARRKYRDARQQEHRMLVSGPAYGLHFSNTGRMSEMRVNITKQINKQTQTNKCLVVGAKHTASCRDSVNVTCARQNRNTHEVRTARAAPPTTQPSSAPTLRAAPGRPAETTRR